MYTGTVCAVQWGTDFGTPALHCTMGVIFIETFRITGYDVSPADKGTHYSFNNHSKNGMINLLRFLEYTVVKLNGMIANKPHQIPKVWISCLIADKAQHVLVPNCNQNNVRSVNSCQQQSILG